MSRFAPAYGGGVQIRQDRTGSGHVAQPAVERDAEAFFGQFKNALGQPARQGLAQEIFARAVAELEAIGQTLAKGHNLIVQKNCPAFQRDHHAGPVGFYQNVIGQIEAGEKEERLAQVIAAGMGFP